MMSIDGIVRKVGTFVFGLPVLSKYRKHAESIYKRIVRFLRQSDADISVASPNLKKNIGKCQDDLIINPKKFDLDGTKIAVYIHLYYVDILDELIYRLKAVTYPFKLFVAVFSTENYSTAFKQLNKTNIDFTIKICENRGRNFGPMLVDFKEIQEYDLLLHLHSKKSLRTGEDNSQWRNELYDGLVGDSYVVSSILSEFMNNPECGLVYSESKQMEDWVNNRLDSNGRILDMLGVNYPKNIRNFLDFPMGGMFWCRTAAIRPLLSYPWSYQDFEPEPIGDGGTIMHDIEHYVGEIVKYSGFGYTVFDFEAGTFRRNSSKKNLDKYRYRSVELLRKIEASTTVSFDFYDTLFCRLCCVPEDVFWYIGFELSSKFGLELDYISIRKNAEQRARQLNSGSDVSIEQIYEVMATEKMLKQEYVEYAKNLEYGIERKILVPRDDILLLAKYAKIIGKDVIVSSDTYMPSVFFDTILKEYYGESLFEEIRVSNELNLRKDDRSYWTFIKKKSSKSELFVHIGDNPESDIHSPVREGVCTGYVINPMPMAALKKLPLPRNWDNDTYKDHMAGILLGPLVARVCSDAIQTDVLVPFRLSNMKDIGYMTIAPTLFAFMSWIKRKCVEERYDKVIFMSREGYYLKKLYDMYIQDGNLPPSDYMFISRTFAIGASMCEDFSADRIVDAGYYSDGTIRDLISYRTGIELDPSINPKLLNLEISLPRDREIVIKAIQSMRDPIVHESMAIRDNMIRYCKSLGLVGSSEKVVTIDIGYSCTIQTALQTAISAGINGLYLSLTRAARRVITDGGTACSFLNEGELPEHEIMGRYSVLMESFLTAPHGHVKDVYNDGVRFVPKFEDKGDLSHMEENDKVFEGVCNYFDKLISVYGKRILDVRWDPKSLQSLFEYVSNNNYVESEVAQNVYIEQNFNGNSVGIYHLWHV